MLAKIIAGIAALWAVILVTNRLKSVTEPNPSIRLTKLEALQVWITCLFAPIFAGAIYYFSWKVKLPTMARQARTIAAILLVLQILAGVALALLILHS